MYTCMYRHIKHGVYIHTHYHHIHVHIHIHDTCICTSLTPHIGKCYYAHLWEHTCKFDSIMNIDITDYPKGMYFGRIRGKGYFKFIKE